MDLSCDRCFARFSTSEEPLPGRAYRVACLCGNTMVVEVGSSGGDARLIASAEFELAPAHADDPFARALRPGTGWLEVTGPVAARLAERDPDAPLDDSAEVHVTGAVSFDDLLRQARMRGFLAGASAGALGAAVIAVVLSLATSRPVATVTIQAIEPRAEAAAPASRTEPPPPPARTAGAARRASGEGAQPGLRPQEVAAAPAPDAPLPSAPVADADVPPLAAEPPVGLDLGAAPSPAAAGKGAPDAPPAPEPSAATSPAAPSSTSAASKAKGPFPEREVAEALRARRTALADCVAATPGTAAGRGHRFALTVVIDPSGRVSDVQIDDPEIEATPLGVCLVRLVHGISFAPFEGEPFRVELALGYGDSE